MKVKPLHPLISCICITSTRPNMLLKSIVSFDQQNYPNTELVISYPISDTHTRNLIAQIKLISDIRILTVVREDNMSIGLARNQAVSKCNGEFVCMWDDDDIYFYSRIADQYNLLQGNGRYFQASMLPQVILFDAVEKQGYLSFPHSWPGSLLCKKQHILSFPCTDTNEFEIAPVIEFLQVKRLLLQSDFSPQLYIYVYHGSNIMDHISFKYLCRKSSPLQEEYYNWITNYRDLEIKLSTP